MKKFLPRTIKNPQGFTLIELLVVIAIIAVLSTIGFAAFRGFAGRGNDEKRQADLNAIANVLEVNKKATGYQLLTADQFTSGKIPTDPASPKVYCIDDSTDATIPANPAAWSTATCPTGYSAVATTTPTADSKSWKVCATLQDGATVSCRTNAQ